MAWCLRHLLLFIMFSEIARLADYGHVVALQLGGDIAEVKVGIIKGADVVLAQHFEQVGADGKLGKFPDNALAVEEEGYLDRRGKAAVGCELSPEAMMERIAGRPCSASFMFALSVLKESELPRGPSMEGRSS